MRLQVNAEEASKGGPWKPIRRLAAKPRLVEQSRRLTGEFA